MTGPRLWVCYLPYNAAEIPFDPAVHCPDDTAGFAFRMSETEGQLATVEIETHAVGWGFLTDGNKGVVLVSTSATGRKEDAVLKARARLQDPPENLFTARQTLRGICAPLDVEKRLLAFAKANLNRKPWVDFLASDADPEDAEAYLLGRTATYRVDPASWVITVVDDHVGARALDLTNKATVLGKPPATKRGPFDRLVEKLRAEVTVEWTQEASGSTGAGLWLRRFDSLDGAISDVNSLVVLKNGTGWTLDAEKSKITKTGYRESSVLAEGTYKITSSKQEGEKVTIRTQSGPTSNPVVREDILWSAGPPIFDTSRTLRLEATFYEHRYEVQDLRFNYSWTQDRSEKLFLVGQCGVAPILHNGNPEDDSIQISVKDIFSEPEIPEYEPGTYKSGDLRSYNGKYWRCIVDHVSSRFSQPRSFTADAKNRLLQFQGAATKICWERYFPVGLLTKESTYTFFGSPRGEDFARHVGLRVRKELLRRLRAYNATLAYRWWDVPTLDTDTSIKFTVDFGDGTGRSIVAKVVDIQWSWDGKGAPTVEVEAAISFGSGRNDRTLDPGTGRYAVEGVLAFGIDAADISDLDYDFLLDGKPAVPGVDVAAIARSGGGIVFLDVENDALAQALKIDGLKPGEPPEQVSVQFPTTMRVTMRDLSQQPATKADFDAAVQVLYSPRGIEL